MFYGSHIFLEAEILKLILLVVLSLILQLIHL